MKFGPFVVRRRQRPGITQFRAEFNFRRSSCALILGQVTSRVPEHHHPHWEAFWFQRPAAVTISGGSHTTKWMVTMPGQWHSIEAPCRVVALKIGPRS